jgi:hypothetical protein
VVGLGARSGYDDARDFAARHRITFRMFWDRGFDSWDGFEVWGQPTSILVSRSGTKLKRWSGPMDDEQRGEATRLAREQG